ncbi:hypothetical protein C0J52_22566 [Blattella germanica]|nr:hypothetical protein C0J52_22566 [Blattella germanica]
MFKKWWVYLRLWIQEALSKCRRRPSVAPFFPSLKDEQMEALHSLLREDEMDSMAISGTDHKGNALYLKINRKENVTEVLIYVQFEDGSIFLLPDEKSPGYTLLTYNRNSWTAGGLKFDMCEPLRRWRISFNGLLRCYSWEQFKLQKKESEEDLKHINFKFIWTTCSDVIDIQRDWSMMLKSEAIAREPWRSPQFTNMGAVFGHLYHSNGSQEPVDFCDLSLAELGENPDLIPEHIEIIFSAGKQKYKVSINTMPHTAVTFHGGNPWNYETHVILFHFVLNIYEGVGIAVFWYKYTGPTASVLPSLPPILKEIEHKRGNPVPLIVDFEDKLCRIVQLFESTPVCGEINMKVSYHLEELAKSKSSLHQCAVRSSPVGDNSDILSSSGQSKTLLAVHLNVSDIMEAIQMCWASLYTFESVQYRRLHGQPIQATMGVIIQLMVQPQTAGVLFTCDPTSGDIRNMILSANYGLGELRALLFKKELGGVIAEKSDYDKSSQLCLSLPETLLTKVKSYVCMENRVLDLAISGRVINVINRGKLFKMTEKLCHEYEPDLEVNGCVMTQYLGICNYLKVLAKELAAGIQTSGKTSIFCNIHSFELIDWLLVNCPLVAAKLDYFLDKFGHRSINEYELMTETWAMKPKELIMILQTMLKDSDEFRKTIRMDMSDRELLSQLKNVKTNVFGTFLSWLLPICRNMVGDKEKSKDCYINVIQKLRLAYHQLANQMTKEGLLPDSKMNKIITDYQETDQDDLVLLTQEQVIKGTTVCPGTVSGRAFVVIYPDNNDELEPGDILITHSTNIGWTPYFPLLSGVVTELGGLFSHGAVVAREYGLPCIIGCQNATTIFKTGLSCL